MDLSRQRILHEIEFQREQLRAEEQNPVRWKSSVVEFTFDDERLDGFSAASGLLKFLKGE